MRAPALQEVTVNALAHGEIKPAPVATEPQVSVQASAFVDDFGAISYQVYDENVSLYFGGLSDNFQVGFTDQSLLNLARLVNQAACAMLCARGIPVPTWIGQRRVED